MAKKDKDFEVTVERGGKVEKLPITAVDEKAARKITTRILSRKTTKPGKVLDVKEKE